MKTTFLILSTALLLIFGQSGIPANETADLSVNSPCELISDAKLNELLGISADAEVSKKNAVRTYPSCFYKWESVTFEVTKNIGGNDIHIDNPTEVNIVLVEDADKEMYQQSIKVYRDGVDLDGIGKMAVWGNDLSQISFLAKGKLIHLYVKKSFDTKENKAAAQKIAEAIIEDL